MLLGARAHKHHNWRKLWGGVGVTVVVATHDQNWVDRYHPNVLRLDHGRLV